MFVLARAITYAVLFIGLILIYVPAELLSQSGIARPESLGVLQIVGMGIGALGAAIALWCVLIFASLGRGTPAPFDPPRRLVVQGPYRYVRNPMYIGAGIALGAAALFYASYALLLYTALFFLMTHLFVVLYEEPTLRCTFGQGYEDYCSRVSRWWPSTSSLKGSNIA
jgi:protein-S-isoprenylcysteine O-methyltransferase Ste14